MKKVTILFCTSALLLLTTTAFAENVDINILAQQLSELQKNVRSLEQTVSEQQFEIRSLKQENTQLKKSHVSPETAVTTAQEIAPAPSPTTKKSNYLPDIGAVADIVALSSESKEDAEGNDKVSVRDFEVVFGHDIDPYSRLDAAIVFSDTEDPELEEAYASFWDLPLDTKLRLGRMKQKIGRAAALHRDSLDTVDVPLVIQRYLGAEGFSKTGFDISGYTPLSADSFTQELILGMMEGGNGEEGQLFGDSRRISSFYARLRNGIDISDITNIDIGTTWLNGSTDNDSGREANSVAFDFTFTHFITPQNRFKLQSEFFLVDRSQSTTSEEENGETVEPLELALDEEEHLSYLDNDHPWGYYILADYRFSERWGLGTRWDWVEPIATELSPVRDDEYALAGYLTFYQSEFARWRLQYQHARLIDDDSDDRIFLQGTFAIGTHKHAIQ